MEFEVTWPTQVISIETHSCPSFTGFWTFSTSPQKLHSGFSSKSYHSMNRDRKTICEYCDPYGVVRYCKNLKIMQSIPRYTCYSSRYIVSGCKARVDVVLEYLNHSYYHCYFCQIKQQSPVLGSYRLITSNILPNLRYRSIWHSE